MKRIGLNTPSLSQLHLLFIFGWAFFNAANFHHFAVKIFKLWI
jgi:hypothetical protein